MRARENNRMRYEYSTWLTAPTRNFAASMRKARAIIEATGQVALAEHIPNGGMMRAGSIPVPVANSELCRVAERGQQPPVKRTIAGSSPAPAATSSGGSSVRSEHAADNRGVDGSIPSRPTIASE